MTRTLILPVLALLLTTLAACQENGGARPLHTEKGVYRGTPDTPLGGEQVEALRQRTFIQRF